MGISDSDWKKRSCKIHETLQKGHFLDATNDADGSKETILEQLERGDTFPETRSKAWAHVIVEISLIRSSQTDYNNILSIISSLEKDVKDENGSYFFADTECIDSDSNVLSSTMKTPRSIEETKGTIQIAKSSNMDNLTDQKQDVKKKMTMIERQELWLKKRQMKIDAHSEAVRLAEAASLKMTPNISNYSKKRASGTEKKSDTFTKSSNRKSRTTKDGKIKHSVNQRKHRTSKKTESIKKKQQKKKNCSKIITTSDDEDKQAHVQKNSILQLLEQNLIHESPSNEEQISLNRNTNHEDTRGRHPKTTEKVEQEQAQILNCSFFTEAAKENHRARYQVRDPNQFQISSMYQKRDRESGLGSAVAVLVGTYDQPPYNEKVIEILFDTEVLSEEKAASWYDSNKYRFESPCKN